MHPLLTALTVVGVFVGMVASFYSGWYVDDWVRSIFSIRARATPTHVEFYKWNAEEDRVICQKDRLNEFKLSYDEPKTNLEVFEGLDDKQRDLLYNLVGEALSTNNVDHHPDDYIDVVRTFEDRKLATTNIFSQNELRALKWGMKTSPYDRLDL